MLEKEKDKVRIGILRGGSGDHYESSLKRGSEIISFLLEKFRHKYKPFDIFIDKENKWHLSGIPINPSQLLYKVDLVWNLSHQRFSNILESFSIKTVGIPAFSPFFDLDREKFREKIKKEGIKMPRHIILPVYQSDIDGSARTFAEKKAREVFEKFSAPWIVKSYNPDMNQGIHLAKTFPELVRAILDGAAHRDSTLVEEFIPGKVGSLHTIPHFRGEKIYSFPFGNSFGSFSAAEREKLIETAKNLREKLGVSHYLKSDFILGKKGEVFLLDFDLAPDLREGSHFGEVCRLAGAKMHEIIGHILDKMLE